MASRVQSSEVLSMLDVRLINELPRIDVDFRDTFGVVNFCRAV